MQYHHDGYIGHNPRIKEPQGTGIDRAEELPDEMDVLIIGAGPGGIVQAAQLTDYPSIHTRIIDRRPGRLEVGRADGLFSRSSETFQAFEFYSAIAQEASHMREMNFWGPDPENPSNIVRVARAPDPPAYVSEFPILTVNQARVIDYFAEHAANGPGRINVNYGYEFVDLEINEGLEHPVRVRLRAQDGAERTVRCKYAVGCDGARSPVRSSIGVHVDQSSASQAWAVMDILVNTDFPDFRTRSGIQSDEHGSILLIPREGGFLTRFYVSLEAPTDETRERIMATTKEESIRRANQILHPYSVDVRNVAWYSIYEVRHTVARTFDDACSGDGSEYSRLPRVFIGGDACHTHSAKAGQGMNVSIQDGWNIAWKLGQVLEGRSRPDLLKTYNSERQVVAQKLIEYDKEWSAMMSKRPEELESPQEIVDFFVSTANFPGGFDTKYPESPIVGHSQHQQLAKGFPIGMRFKSAPVTRLADVNRVHVGHHFRADGRWRLYMFADAEAKAAGKLAQWLCSSPDSPVQQFTPAGQDIDSVFDAKIIYQQDYDDIDINSVHHYFRPRVGKFQVMDWEKIYTATPDNDIFDARGIDRSGALVIVRPDMYVAHVLPLSAREEITDFFEQSMSRQRGAD